MTRWRRREGGGSCRGGRASRGRRNRRRRTSEVADRGVERPFDRIRLDDLQVRLLDDERRGFGDARRGEDGEGEEEEEDRPLRGRGAYAARRGRRGSSTRRRRRRRRRRRGRGGGARSHGEGWSRRARRGSATARASSWFVRGIAAFPFPRKPTEREEPINQTAEPNGAAQT